MAAQPGERIRVILRKIQINDNLEPFYDDEGEFRFRVRVTSRDGIHHETAIPKEGYFIISDHPSWNRRHLNEVVFEGEVRDHLEVEISGEELDIGANDHLPTYRREFTGPPSEWIGRYEPVGDESTDPERMKEWWIFMEIQPA